MTRERQVAMDSLPGSGSCTQFIVVLMILTATLFSPGVKANADEITLRLLVWDGYVSPRTRERFSAAIKSKYNIDLDFEITDASDPDDFFDKLRMEKADIISPAHNLARDSRYNLTTNGLTLPIDLSAVPNYQKLLPHLRKQSWAMEKEKVYGVPVAHGIYGLAYNTDIVKTPPTSWEVLWDPRYKGRYTVHRDYYELNIYISALALGHDRDRIFHYDRIKGPALEQKIDQLAANAGVFWKGFDRPEHYRDMALATTWRISFPQIDDSFRKWRIAVPREGTTWWIDTIMLSHTLERRPMALQIAHEFINYLLTPEVQLLSIARTLGTCPVTVSALDTYMKTLLPPEDAPAFEKLFKGLIPWKTLATRDRNAFKLLWNEALAKTGKEN
ncbi:MAG: extracellular solute-binding protein [Desulfobacteraceae bacterium]|nr:extracellular solute-binding protein [Desulfobacteraceae bacterium]